MTKKFLIVDAHEDMALNMVCFGRDYTRPVAETRQKEKGAQILEWNQDSVLGWDVYQQGRVGIVFSTLFGAPIRHQEGAWDTQVYRDYNEAHQIYRAQLDAYHRLVEDHPDKFRLLTTKAGLDAHLAQWEQASENIEPPVGLVVLMEAAEAVREPAELELWWELGVRVIGPAWGMTRYCGGTREPGPLTQDGYDLLDGMAEFGFTLDLSHMDEEAALQALDHYPEQVIASHANAKALLKGTDSNRFLTDRLIEGIVERDGVIGVVPYNVFLKVGWKKGDPRQQVTLEDLAAHIDHICQIAGDAKHAGFGSDADGGFGLQSMPLGMDTLADLQKLAPLLAEKGYSEKAIGNIFGGNWISILKETLPESA
jgi:membrane dipeptidase